MPTCPNGHPSQSDDWCEVCGLRMSAPSAGPGVPAAPPPPPFAPAPSAVDPDATVAAEPCPHCGTLREGQAAFCEECRYNFVSHTASAFPSAPPAPAYSRLDFPPPYERTTSRPSQVNRPAEPLPPHATISGENEGGDFLLSPPSGGRGAPVPEPSQAPEPSVRHEQSELPGRREPYPPGAQSAQPAAAQQAAEPASRSASGSASRPAPDAAAGQVPQTAAAAGSPSEPQTADPATAAWSAVVTADRDYFTAMMTRSGSEGSGLYFPTYSPEQFVPLTGHQVTIGRRRHSTGEAPDIDLSRPPEDPGVSHKHAVLVRKPDGGWSVVDQDSTNGTTVNGGADPIAPFQPVDLADGDRVHVGAWTTITLRRD